MKVIKLVVALAMFSGAFAHADVGMITQLSGDVSVTIGSNTQPAKPFFKLNTGDKLAVSNGGRVQIVYFGNGRQEVWKDGVQLEVGSVNSTSAGKPDVTQLPPLVALQLAKMPTTGQQSKAGMIRMRSMTTPETYAQLDKQYGDLKRRADADDTTPEVYLLSGLVELKDFKRAKSVLAELEGKASYRSVVEYFSVLVNNEGK